jgi:tripartite-type tricarboxylate transporter receptor subunit TctC
MTFARRRFLQMAAGASVLPVVSRMARAQTYPSGPVRIVVPYDAGGVQDITGRLIGKWLTDRLGQPFSIENVPGEFGNVGVEKVARAPADGYTLMITGSGVAINQATYEKLNFDFLRDIAPIAGILNGTFVVIVNLSVPATTVPQLIEYAKANPGQMKMASTGNAGGPHLIGALFQMMTGTSMVHMPFKGSVEAMKALREGQVQILFDTTPPTIKHIREGSVRALAVTSTTRLEVLPNLPTVGEFVPGYEASGFSGLFAPKDTPGEIIEKLNKETNAGLADSQIKARIVELGATPLPITPADFTKRITAEIEKWAKVVKSAGIKVQ